jgi:hypothetical protein
MYMQNNATATVITTASTPVKVEGATTAGASNQRFSHSNNRLTYDGARTRYFKVVAMGSMINAGNNDEYGLYIYKNGSAVVESEKYITANGAGRVESFAIQAVVELSTSDYVEIWIENVADVDDATISFLNVIINPIT